MSSPPHDSPQMPPRIPPIPFPLPSVTDQLLSDINAYQALSDEDLHAQVSAMSPEAFQQFLFPTELKALLGVASPTMSLGQTPTPDLLVTTSSSSSSGPSLIPGHPSVQLQPGRKFRASSEPGMSGHWSSAEDRRLFEAVELMKSQSPRLDWSRISAQFPFRTTGAVQHRYFDRKQHANSDDDDVEDDDALHDLSYFNSFREWLQAPL
jgi:hypothetical protein